MKQFNCSMAKKIESLAKGGKSEAKKSEDFDMNQAFFQAKKAITDWTKRQGHKTLEWLYTDGRKSPTSYPSGIWDFEWDTGNGMATAELKVSPYETRTNSWNDSMDFSLRVGTEDKPTFYTSVEDVLSALDTLISETEESKKSEGDDDKGCKGKDCKDDTAKKNEADSPFKVGDFVTYDAASDGKEDFINQYVSAEIAEINGDGSLVLWIYDLDDGGNDVKDADPQFCTKLDHFAGKVDAGHYYMDGPYKAYKGGWEILITKKDLNPRVYEFIGTMDDLGEVLDVDAYYGGENFVYDQELEGAIEQQGWAADDMDYADMSGDLAKAVRDSDESKKSEDFRNYTLKQLRFQLKNGWAKDLTNASDEEIQAIIDSGHSIGGVSNGTYGMNGLLVNYTNPDGSLGSGVVIGRTPNLFALLSPQKPKKTGDAPKPSESKKSEGLPPKKLGNRLYRSRADLINKMKTLDAVEITTPAQFNDIHSKQWLHTAGYAMDINGNLVGQTYFGDKDGKWYYATTKTFQGDYLPECKEEAKKGESMERCDSCGAIMTEYEYDRYGGLCKRCRERDESKKSESYPDWIAFYFCVDNLGDEYAVYPQGVHDRNGVKVVDLQSQYSPIGYHEAYKKDYILDVMKPIPLDEVENSAIYKKLDDGEDREIIAIDKKDAERIMNASNPLSELFKVVHEYDIYKGEGIVNVKKSESLTLKQKELKNMARYGEATDITTISDAEAKELKKKGIETVGISRGAYGMNGALLRDNEGNKYVITARSSNLFYFV